MAMAFSVASLSSFVGDKGKAMKDMKCKTATECKAGKDCCKKMMKAATALEKSKCVKMCNDKKAA